MPEVTAFEAGLDSGIRVRVVDQVKDRYFVGSDQAKRAGRSGNIAALCGRPFEEYVYVDFDLQPRQQRQRLREFIAVRDLTVVRDTHTIDC